MARKLLLLVVLLVGFAGVGWGRPSQPGTLSLAAIIDRGTVVYLTDGSAWEVRTENRSKAAAWPKKVKISVYRSGDRDWPFRLILRPGNADGDVISAKRLVRYR